MRRLLPILLLTALIAALAAGCGGGGSSSAKSVPGGSVALVGGQTISKQAFNGLLDQAKTSFVKQKRVFPKAGTPEFKALQDQAVQYLVQRSEFEQKAKDLGITVTDQQINARLQQVKKQYFAGSETRYRAQLKAQGLTEKQVRDDIKAQLISEGIFKKVTSNVKASDKDILAYYNLHRSQYSQAASRDVRHILVLTKPLADKIAAQLTAGASFAALAKQYSKDPGSAAQGGKLTVSKGQTVPQFDKAAFSLKVNQTSPPIKTQYGWHIIQALSAIRPAKQTPFSQVKASIKQQLEQTKKNDLMTAWVNDTKKNFCGGKLAYQVGYQPLTDPCATLSTSGSTATTTK